MIWYLRYNQISIFLFLVEVLRQETNKHKIRLFASHVTATFVCGYCCHVCGLYLFPSGKKIEILPFSKGSLLLLLTLQLWLRNFRAITTTTVTFRQGDKKINSICIILHCLKSCLVYCFPLFLFTIFFNHMTLSFQRS